MDVKKPSTNTAIGRPKKNHDIARAALIEAARAKFIHKSYDKVSIRELAQAAGVNSAMIKYYFENKEGLYKAMILEVTGQVMADIKRHIQSENFASLEDVFLSFSQVMKHSPEFPLLMLKEVVLDQGVCRDFFLEQMGHSHIKIFDQIYLKLKKKGKLRTGIDPVLFRLSLMGLMIYPWYLREPMKKMEGIEYNDEFLVSLAKHNSQLMSHGFFNEPYDENTKGNKHD